MPTIYPVGLALYLFLPIRNSLMNSDLSTAQQRIFLSFLVLISMAPPLGMNIILPSLTSIQVAFDTEYAMAQMTLTLYLASVAFGQLIYGPLSDRFGRRPIVLFGLCVLMIGSLICYLSTSIEMMIAGRVIQAVGGCTGMVMGRAMVRDLYDSDKAASMIAYLTMAIVVAPSLAPLLGGFLEDGFGWRASFAFVLIFAGLVLLLALRTGRETLPPEKRQETHFLHMFRSFGYLLRNPAFTSYALQVSFNTAAYFGFLGGAAFVLIGLMGGSPTELGVYFAIISAFYIAGNFVTARLAQKIGVFRMVMLGTIVAILGPVLMLVVELVVGMTPFSFFGLISIVALGNGFCISSGMAGAISADPERIGASSGLAGSMQIGFGAICTFISGVLLSHYETSVLPLIFVVGACCILGFLSLAIGHIYTSRMIARSLPV